MKKTISILCILFCASLFAENEKTGDSGVINRVPVGKEITPPNNVASKAECDTKGGQWFEDAKYDYRYCVIPYPDAGKLCKNSKDCIGHCTWPLDEMTIDGKQLEHGYGICQLNDATDDCGRPHYENGEVIYFNCD